ncbi:hypothetical protein A2U01_0036224, partial [Trifolium medium]|nr:hypothetical protein [Trifolium medium]
MVIIRELSDSEDQTSRNPKYGSDWERQARSHYIRADGTRNYAGYFSECWGFEVAPSDLDSDTSSEDDSDCVEIPASSFVRKNPNRLALVIADGVSTISTSMEISSKFTSSELIVEFRKAFRLSDQDDETFLITEPVEEGEFVTTVNTHEPHYFY